MISFLTLNERMGTNVLVSALNKNFQQIDSENRTKVIKDENGVNRIIIGRFPDGTYGVAITKESYDVLEELGNG